MWPAQLIHSFSSHHHGRRCTSCWAMTIVGQGKAPVLRKHELESGDRHVFKHDTSQADMEWVQRVMGAEGRARKASQRKRH